MKLNCLFPKCPTCLPILHTFVFLMNFFCTVNLITNFNTAFMRKLLGTLVLCLLCTFYVEGQTVFGNVRDSNGEGLP